MSAFPALGLASPSNIRSVVVLPAPFGPRKPVIVPGASANESESTARTDPNRFVNESATTAGIEASTVPVGVGSDNAASPLLVEGVDPRRCVLGSAHGLWGPDEWHDFTQAVFVLAHRPRRVCQTQKRAWMPQSRLPAIGHRSLRLRSLAQRARKVDIGLSDVRGGSAR